MKKLLFVALTVAIGAPLLVASTPAPASDAHDESAVEKPTAFACTWAGCNKQYKDKRNFNVHTQAHRKGKQFACDMC